MQARNNWVYVHVLPWIVVWLIAINNIYYIWKRFPTADWATCDGAQQNMYQRGVLFIMFFKFDVREGPYSVAASVSLFFS